MIKLEDAAIKDGLPALIGNQQWAKALSAVYCELHGNAMSYLKPGVSSSEVDECSEDMLDQLAIYLKIEWYNSLASIEEKRRTVKTAIEIQRFSGTAAAVRSQVNAVYPNSDMLEWWQYDGTPGHWWLKVNITNAETQYHTIEEMESLLGYTRRLSAHLERITYLVDTDNPMAYAAAAHTSTVMKMTATIHGDMRVTTITAQLPTNISGTRQFISAKLPEFTTLATTDGDTLCTSDNEILIAEVRT